MINFIKLNTGLINFKIDQSGDQFYKIDQQYSSLLPTQFAEYNAAVTSNGQLLFIIHIHYN